MPLPFSPNCLLNPPVLAFLSLFITLYTTSSSLGDSILPLVSYKIVILCGYLDCRSHFRSLNTNILKRGHITYLWCWVWVWQHRMIIFAPSGQLGPHIGRAAGLQRIWTITYLPSVFPLKAMHRDLVQNQNWQTPRRVGFCHCSLRQACIEHKHSTIVCSEHVTVVVLAGLCCCYVLKYSSLHTELVVLSCFLDTRVAFFFFNYRIWESDIS